MKKVFKDFENALKTADISLRSFNALCAASKEMESIIRKRLEREENEKNRKVAEIREDLQNPSLSDAARSMLMWDLRKAESESFSPAVLEVRKYDEHIRELKSELLRLRKSVSKLNETSKVLAAAIESERNKVSQRCDFVLLERYAANEVERFEKLKSSCMEK